MKKRVIAVIAVLALSVAMFGCKAGSDTGNGKKQREESAGDMGTEGKATAEEETEIQVFIAAVMGRFLYLYDRSYGETFSGRRMRNPLYRRYVAFFGSDEGKSGLGLRSERTGENRAGSV